jgi:hypothetical protein
MVWYGMVWYGMVWYGMVWYGMVWYGMVWYGMVWYVTDNLISAGTVLQKITGVHELQMMILPYKTLSVLSAVGKLRYLTLN